jgi:predicted XRE-type DNA-binding protein
MTHIYDATARREGRWWIITIPELDAVTQARTVHEIDIMARGLVEALLDLDEGQAIVNVAVELPASVADQWSQARTLQAQADDAVRRAAAMRRDVVRTLIGREHLSQADASAILGISYQRVQQLSRT